MMVVTKKMYDDKVKEFQDAVFRRDEVLQSIQTARRQMEAERQALATRTEAALAKLEREAEKQVEDLMEEVVRLNLRMNLEDEPGRSE